MADRGYGARNNDGLGRETKAGLVLGAVLTLGTLIAILVPTVGPNTRRWR